jgi:hypothetical protein
MFDHREEALAHQRKNAAKQYERERKEVAARHERERKQKETLEMVRKREANR